MGIVGILAYGYNYVVKGVVLFKNPRNTFNLFVIVVAIGFEGYSMIDTGTMIPFPYMMLVTIMMCVVEMFTSTKEATEIDKLEWEEMKRIREEKRALRIEKRKTKSIEGEEKKDDICTDVAEDIEIDSGESFEKKTITEEI